MSVGSDYPGTLIRDDSLAQLKIAKDELGFRTIRFHAIFHDVLGTYKVVDGKPVYDMMIALLDPATTKLQFQVSTMQEGYDPVTYFKKYSGRFLSMHCQDWVKDPSTKSGFKQVALGKGLVDWKAVFAAAGKAGVKNYFVELEEDPSLLPPSVPYLKSLKV